MAEQAKATKDTPRRVAAKTGVRRTSRTTSSGGTSSENGSVQAVPVSDEAAEQQTDQAAAKTPTRGRAAGTRSTAAKAKGSAPAGPNDADGRYTELREVLEARLAELSTEYDAAVVTLTDLQRSRVADGAGDDQADTGTKTFEREQELSLVHGLHERVQQVEHALARLAEGTYGSCERCGNPIPTARLEAFPSVTLCVSCKQIEERR
jgi:DnaK suppressor protein